ncbi:putative WRKY transcription factor 70 [Canna indica]|uniref:WRKY transcription factor 70 n=1 Tax=Canna indica TaxID=4628 RepID=A0AAQ3QP90_9LILI|nr:putative WRKY transcription factor 70 [Canna indica]
MFAPNYGPVDDHKLSPIICNHWKVVEEINRAHELTSQLRAILLPLLPSSDCWSELTIAHLGEMNKCYDSALSRLRAASSFRSTPPDPIPNIDHRRGINDHFSSKNKRKGIDGIDWPKDHKIRRKDASCSVVTSVPYDGHQWRKYGQKFIHGAKHPRNYFRCSYKKDQGCQAKKTEQQDDNDATKYHMVYTMSHTCKIVQPSFPFSLEPVVPDITSLNSNDNLIHRSSSFVVQDQQYLSPDQATPNFSSSSINGDQEPMHQATAPGIPGKLDVNNEILSSPSTWEDFEFQAYLGAMMDI